MKLNNLVSISYGSMGGDCTCRYYIDKKQEFTVQDFVSAVLENTAEWGSIYIYTNKSDYDYKIEYAHGKLKNTIPDNILTKQVYELNGCGGWSLSDYNLTLKKKGKNRDRKGIFRIFK